MYPDDVRRCTADGEPALFHCWEQRSWIVEPSPMVGGHGGGVVSSVWAIVELRDGTVKRVDPTKIKFMPIQPEAYGMGEWKV